LNLQKRRITILLIGLIGTFVLTRSYLQFSPNKDFNVAGYNIHHLFTGLILITLGGVPLVLSIKKQVIADLSTGIFGIGLSLALDEWVYLIATDGSNASYLLPISFWGGAIMVGLASLYVFFLYLFGKRVKN